MTTVARKAGREIDGKGRTIRELLAGQKYSIDYYQREYKWQLKQIAELIGDLVAAFNDSHEDGNDRSAVAEYGHYFLGSIIVSDKDGAKFIIDGQQRLTSITLLLIFLLHKVTDEDQKAQLAELIFSQKYGRRSFNLDVPERASCMEALYAQLTFDEIGQSDSVVNLRARFADIADEFPEQLLGTPLPYFVDWLIENVHLVQITAYSDGDAYTIFETMNDRGLSLTPADMLKGYLLANIADEQIRTSANTTWKTRLSMLAEIGKDEDADGIKAWLRSQYANSIRERKRAAEPKDFELIATEFHRWVRDHEGALGLKNSTDFAHFIERDLSFYTGWYARIRQAGNTLATGLESVYYNAQLKFTLQYALLLSPLRIEDHNQVAIRKLRVVSAYIDILIHRRLWNFRAIDYSSMQYTMFLLIRDIRRMTVEQLVSLLTDRLNEPGTEHFSSNDRFALHGMNARQIHDFLARMMDYVERSSGQPSRYVEYMQRGGKNGYEIEHIWPNHPERHIDEFPESSDFVAYRNRIGGLLLLPKSFNASYGDLPYPEKRAQYNAHNLLARSLLAQAYDHNPGFLRLIESSGLPFHEHTDFKRADFDERHDLYRRLAEHVWSSERLAQEAAKT